MFDLFLMRGDDCDRDWGEKTRNCHRVLASFSHHHPWEGLSNCFQRIVMTHNPMSRSWLNSITTIGRSCIVWREEQPANNIQLSRKVVDINMTKPFREHHIKKSSRSQELSMHESFARGLRPGHPKSIRHWLMMSGKFVRWLRGHRVTGSLHDTLSPHEPHPEHITASSTHFYWTQGELEGGRNHLRQWKDMETSVNTDKDSCGVDT